MKPRRVRDAATASSAEHLQETTVFYSRDHGLLPKRPRSFAQETTVFWARDHGLLPWRPWSLFLFMPISGAGPGARTCFGQGGSVSTTARLVRREWTAQAISCRGIRPNADSLFKSRLPKGTFILETAVDFNCDFQDKTVVSPPKHPALLPQPTPSPVFGKVRPARLAAYVRLFACGTPAFLREVPPWSFGGSR